MGFEATYRVADLLCKLKQLPGCVDIGGNAKICLFDLNQAQEIGSDGGSIRQRGALKVCLGVGGMAGCGGGHDKCGDCGVCGCVLKVLSPSWP